MVQISIQDQWFVNIEAVNILLKEFVRTASFLNFPPAAKEKSRRSIESTRVDHRFAGPPVLRVVRVDSYQRIVGFPGYRTESASVIVAEGERSIIELVPVRIGHDGHGHVVASLHDLIKGIVDTG